MPCASKLITPNLSLNIKDLIPERYKHQFDDYLARVKQNGHDSGLMRGLTKDGREIIAEYKTVLLKDLYERPIGIKGSARDVTRQIHAEKEKEKLEDQLHQVHKMQAIGTRLPAVLLTISTTIYALFLVIPNWPKKMYCNRIRSRNT